MTFRFVALALLSANFGAAFAGPAASTSAAVEDLADEVLDLLEQGGAGELQCFGAVVDEQPPAVSPVVYDDEVWNQPLRSARVVATLFEDGLLDVTISVGYDEPAGMQLRRSNLDDLAEFFWLVGCSDEESTIGG